MAMLISTVGFSKKVIEKTPASTTCLPATIFMYSVVAIPATIPIYPKNVVITTLSDMMSQRMDDGFAPSAFLIPNSCVLSLTVISMILLTPTIPLSRVKIPTTHIEILGYWLPTAVADIV